MKRVLAIVMLVSLLATVSVAQERVDKVEKGQRPNKEQISKMKIKRVVKELALDNKSAQKFTEVYTDYQQGISLINEKYSKGMPDFDMTPDKTRSRKEMKDQLMPTDDQVVQEIMEGFARERALLDLKEKYYHKFSKFMTPQQIQKMYRMENAPRRMQGGNMQPPQGGFPGGSMGGGMTPPPGMW